MTIPIVQIIPIMKNIRNTCNTMLFCNYIFFFFAYLAKYFSFILTNTGLFFLIAGDGAH